MWLHSLKAAQLLRSAACLHTNQSRSYLNHLVFHVNKPRYIGSLALYIGIQGEDRCVELKICYMTHNSCSNALKCIEISVMNECNECKPPKIVKIRYISYTFNLFKTIAVASLTRAVTVNSLHFSKYLQFVTLALVLSTRQCRHSSLYYQECNELLIILYIIDVTSHTLSLSARHTRRTF